MKTGKYILLGIGILLYAIAYYVFSIFSCVSFMHYKRELLGAILSIALIAISLYYLTTRLTASSAVFTGCILRFYNFVNRKSALIFVIITAALIAWSGYFIFLNPYLCEYNHGNAAYYTQVLHNLLSGIGPEQSVKSSCALFYTSNPYFYTSIFSVTAQFLHMLLLTPLYWFYPYPPMHVFAVVLLVFSFGALGAYLAIRAMNGSKVLALMGAIGYCLLPWVTMPVFFAGAFDNLGFVIYPYVIMAIFARRWTLYYLFITLLCLINIPYAYLAMAIGLVTALFFKAKTQGFAAILIGLIVTVFDIILVRKSLSGIYTAAMPGYHKLLSCMVLNHEPLLRAIAYHFSYTTELFFTVAFLPFTCIYAFKRWNLSMLGLLALAGAGCFLGIFRSYYWFNHRAAGMVVPIYLSGFFAYIFIKNRDFYIKRFKVKAHVLAGIALFAAVTSVIFWFSWQYPWAQARHLIRSNNFSNISGIGKVYILRQSPNNERFSFVLSKAREFIPPKASVVYRVDSGIEAFFANRQMAWQAGNHPDGAEYYIIQLKAIEFIRDDYPGWQELESRLSKDTGYACLYKDDNLVIYKNLYPVDIPRKEDSLGWPALLRLFPAKRTGPVDYDGKQ